MGIHCQHRVLPPTSLFLPLGSKPGLVGRIPLFTVLCTYWCSFRHQQIPIFPLAVSHLPSVTEASCSQPISWMTWTRQQSLNWARYVLGLAAQPSFIMGHTKMLSYPSICCLDGHFATTGFCNFSLNISFLFIGNPTFLLPCEIKETEGSQSWVK